MSREWFSKPREYLQYRAHEDSGDINWKIEEAFASARLIAMDMSILFSKMGKREIPFDQFMAENEVIGKQLAEWKDNMDPALKDPRWLVKDFSGGPPRDPENDIVDPYLQNTLYHGPLWATNQMMIDWYAVELMHKYQTALILQTQPSKELAMASYASCQLFEAIEYWPNSPKGSVIACQATLGIAALFLPQDNQHYMWCRRKLAVVEALGFVLLPIFSDTANYIFNLRYIYPLTFRVKMAALFKDPSCNNWWLPNELGLPPVIRSMRRFVEERTSQARDAPAEDLYNIKAIFSSLKLDDEDPSRESGSQQETLSQVEQDELQQSRLESGGLDD